MKIAIINGPNLNRLGKRNPDIYGPQSLDETLNNICQSFKSIEFDCFQSNSEGEIIDKIQQLSDDPLCGGIVINPGAYAHYSYAIADAIRDTQLPVVEVHISNIHARESFRAHSVTAAAANAIISGCGRNGYALAVSQILLITQK